MPAGRIGLALAGGGPLGAVYEIGALRALDEAIEGLDCNALDVYVGVSAGSLIASFLANGISPTQMVRSLVGAQSDDDPLLPSVFFTPAYREWARRAAQLPALLGESAWEFLQHPNPFRSLRHLRRAIPVAVFDNEPLRRALEHAFSENGRVDDFRQLDRTLIVVATDLGAGKAVRFGSPGWEDVSISTAVQASTAFPGLYPPVQIGDRYCVDGVLLKTVHASVAFDAGAKLVLCVNPIVPTDTSAGIAVGALRRGSLVRGGLPTVLSQTFRTLVYSRLQVGFAAYGARYEDAEFVLLEPDRDQYEMFFSNVFSFSSRRAVCELAYDATRRDLLRRADELAPVFARRGLRLRQDVLADTSRDVWSSAGVDVSKRRRRRRSPIERLNNALDRLERVFDE